MVELDIEREREREGSEARNSLRAGVRCDETKRERTEKPHPTGLKM